MSVKDCWTILGINPTDDLGAIKRAYRAQVKRYHPDTVRTVDEKRRYTIICADINQAYRQAMRQIRASAATGEDYSYEPETASEQAFSESKSARRPILFISLFRSSPLLGGFLIFFLALQLISFFAGPFTAVPDFLKTTVSLAVALFVAVFFYGMLLGGALDLLIIWLFPKIILNKAGLEKHEAKILWITVVSANVAVFFFTNVIPSAKDAHSDARLLGGALRIIAAATFPAVLALKRLRELIEYRKVKADTGELSAE